MREIKFRAWIEDELKYVYPGERNYFLCNNGGLFRIVNLSDKYGQDFLVMETKSIIEQYTGLKDKNGKEIYEGDILSSKNDGQDGADVWGYDEFENRIVEWNELECCYKGLPDFFNGSVFSLNRIEVIGNIHEGVKDDR